MTLFIPVGVPASGKSYLSGKLIEAGVITANMIVSPDHLRRWLTGKTADQSANGKVFDIAEMVATERLYRGLSVYLDATNLTDPKGMLGRLAHIAEHRNDDRPQAPHEDYPVVTIIMDTPMDECVARNKDRGGHAVPDKIMVKMIDRFISGDYPRHGTVIGSTQAIGLNGTTFPDLEDTVRVSTNDLDRKT